MAARRSAWKTLAVLLGALLLLVAAFLGWMEWTTYRGWAELRQRSKDELAEELRRPLPRVFLRPQRGPGHAWGEYPAAMAAVTRLTSPEQILLGTYLRTDDADLRGEVRALLEKNLDVLDLLARGAAAGNPASGAAERNAETGNPLSWRIHHVATLALCAARLDVDRGLEAEAVDRIGQVLQLVRDLQDLWPSEGLYKSQAILTQVREQLGHLLAGRKLGASGRAELERLLEALEASWPSGESVLRRDVIETRSQLVRWEAEGKLVDYLGGPRRGLLKLLSDRQRALAYEQSCRAGILAVRGSDAWDGRRFREFLDGWQQGEEGGGDVLMYAQVLRQLRTEAALMRAGLAWVRTGEPPAREDPSGRVLMSREEKGGILIWGAGWNGLDDGGGKKDLVLRARR